MLPPLAPNWTSKSGQVSTNGVVFLSDMMDDEQIEETRTLLKEERSSWNHVMAVSERAFAAVSDCLIGSNGSPWSLHLSFIGSDPNVGDDDDHLSVLSHVHLHSLQLDLWKENTSWNAACVHLRDNNALIGSLTKLILPRYTLTGNIASGLTHFMHNHDAEFISTQQRLSALTWISIEMDDDLLPNEQQFASDLCRFYDMKRASNLKNPIYLNLHQYCIDRLQVLECAFDIFMAVIHGLWKMQYTEHSKRKYKSYDDNHSNDNHHDRNNDHINYSDVLQNPLCIQSLTIYPPILKREMLPFTHSLHYRNAPNLISLQFQNWSTRHLACFCSSIQRLVEIQYQHSVDSKDSKKLKDSDHSNHSQNGSKSNKSRRRRKRRRGQCSLEDLDEIIAEMDSIHSLKEKEKKKKRMKKKRDSNNNTKSNVLESVSLFHHLQSFKINVKNPSLLFNDHISSNNNHNATTKDIANKSKHQKAKKKKIRKLYDPKGTIPKFECFKHIEDEMYGKGVRALLGMGDILRFQFGNLFEFGLNHYHFLFMSEHFMVRLLNGLSVHPYIRNVELQGIGREGHHAVNAMDLSMVIRCSLTASQRNYIVIDQTLEQYLSSKDVRLVVMKCLYGEEYGNGGSGILRFDVSTNKKSAHRRHSIFSGLQTIKRQQNSNVIDTKLEGFEQVLTALDRNWRESGLGQSELYWEWKKCTKKITNVPRMRYFEAM